MELNYFFKNDNVIDFVYMEPLAIMRSVVIFLQFVMESTIQTPGKVRNIYIILRSIYETKTTIIIIVC